MWWWPRAATAGCHTWAYTAFKDTGVQYEDGYSESWGSVWRWPRLYPRRRILQRQQRILCRGNTNWYTCLNIHWPSCPLIEVHWDPGGPQLNILPGQCCLEGYNLGPVNIVIFLCCTHYHQVVQYPAPSCPYFQGLVSHNQHWESKVPQLFHFCRNAKLSYQTMTITITIQWNYEGINTPNLQTT